MRSLLVIYRSFFFVRRLLLAGVLMVPLWTSTWAAEPVARPHFKKELLLSPCMNCHTDKFLEAPYRQWLRSTHRRLVDPESPAKRDGCVYCHTGQGFSQDRKKAAGISHPVPQTCVACHAVENHGKVPAHVRIYGKVTLPSGMTVMGAGTGAVCMACHNSRRNVTNAKIFESKRAPHASTQADMLLGDGAFEIPGYRYSNSVHTSIENGCVSCHMASPSPAAAGLVGKHTFKVSDGKRQNTQACLGCHTRATAFERLALGDFDGNRVLEHVQGEVRGLLHVVGKALEQRIDGGRGGKFSESHGKVVFKDKEGRKIPSKEIPEAQYIAAYNYFFVLNDNSQGIHNTAYAVQLLQSAYLNLTGKPVPNAYIR